MATGRPLTCVPGFPSEGHWASASKNRASPLLSSKRDRGLRERDTSEHSDPKKWETYTLNETTDHSFRHTP